MSQNPGTPVPVAIVGRSALFPVAMIPRAFWPNLLALKGLMAGLATSQWPFNEFFSTQDLNNLKEFVMKSGLLSSGSLPADGFEIPPEVLKISAVIPVVSLFLARQALEDVKSFKNGILKPEKIKAVIETRSYKEVKSTTSNDSITEKPSDIATIFAQHFGFVTCPVDGRVPLPGTLSWLGTAFRELQHESIDMVITGSADAAHPVLSFTEDMNAAVASLREGLSMIALRRLHDAERDGDQVLAVISGCDASSVSFIRKGCPAEVLTPEPSQPPPAVTNLAIHPMPAPTRQEQLARFSRLPVSDIIIEADGSCRNLPFNHLSEDCLKDGSLDWKRVRDCWVKRASTRRFFHDLLGSLFGTFVRRVVVQNPDAFAAVANRPVIFLANHQIGLESPLFMALAYGMTGLPIQAVAKPDHVNAWLAFLLAFAQDSLGDGHPFRLMYFDRQNPQQLIDTLKKAGPQEASLLVHVEGTRAAAANQPVTRLSSIFLDMAIDKNLPMVPVRFVGGLPTQASEERFDFPYGNGKQDYLIGAPIMPGQLQKMPYGQRPRFIMDLINNLGPGKGEDTPLPPEQAFEAKTRFFLDTFGFPKMQAMLFAILQMIDDPCEETAQLVKAVQSGKVDPRNPEIPPVLKNFLVHIKTKFA
ncbi:MAG: 1-acyl-sn-glycerol-3-phosphate acyltransferase [Candidatus Riflebacteria bacterium]|nr:1-acyl-sn-glycerol-3-phosphate acyltransferase [Candidatus Riflebacteria bacterium]